MPTTNATPTPISILAQVGMPFFSGAVLSIIDLALLIDACRCFKPLNERTYQEVACEKVVSPAMSLSSSALE
jgi:hypothetical protein